MVAFGGRNYAMLTLFSAFIAQMSSLSMTWWLSVWVTAYDHEDAIDIGFYLGVYAAMLASYILLAVFKIVVFRNGAWFAAKELHERLVKAVLEVSLR